MTVHELKTLLHALDVPDHAEIRLVRNPRLAAVDASHSRTVEIVATLVTDDGDQPHTVVMQEVRA